jgi:hypothetical protein
VFVRNIKSGETGWFSSPGLVDLNGDGKKEIVASPVSATSLLSLLTLSPENVDA